MNKGRDTALPAAPIQLLAVAAAAISAGPGQAQSVADKTTAERQRSSQPDSNPEAADSRADDIVVTARRQPEPLQRVPISVVALTANDLESRSITNLRTLQNFVPNLTFAPSQNVGEAAGNVFIRGIGQEDFGAGADPGVGLYVDGVYFARTLGTIMNVIDISRVEVLRGPQGTLFGKNTIGGAINIITKQPEERRERNASILLGNYNRFETRVVANEPLTPSFLMRIAFGAVSRSGYVRRISPPADPAILGQLNGVRTDLRREGNERNIAGRVQFRWLVSPTAIVDFSLDASRVRNHQGATHLDFIDPRTGIFPELNELIGAGRLPGPRLTNTLASVDLLESRATGHNQTKQDFWGASLLFTKQLGESQMKLIGAYRGLRSRIETDTDGLYFDIAENQLRVNERQLSVEAQLTGVWGRLSYAAGLFAFDERSKLPPNFGEIDDILYTCGCFYPPGVLPLITMDARRLGTTSAAVYAQGTYRIDRKLSFTGGARYSYEHKAIRGKAYRLDADLQPTGAVAAVASNEDRWNSVTYRLGAEYQATANFMAYGSVAKGFKSGGFNVRTALGVSSTGFAGFGPETGVTFELGIRSDWLRRRLRLNATIFQTIYHDIQLRQQSVFQGTVATLIQNAAKARIRGAEFELLAWPLEALTVRAVYGHLDPQYLDVGRVPRLTLDSRFQRTPSHSLSISVDYSVPLRAAFLELHGDYSYRSKEQFQIVPALNDQRAYGLVAARIAYRSANDRWSIAIFGTNLRDKRYRAAGRGTLVNQAGLAYSSVGMPRQIGIQMGTQF